MGDIEKATTEELEAALHARRELGRGYETELVESFVDRIGAQIDARVDARLAEGGKRSSKGNNAAERQLVLGFVSLGTGIPITAIAGGTGDVAGIIAAWTGIAVINVAYALAGRRQP